MAVSAPRPLDTPAERVDATIAKAIAWLDRDQTPEGFWVGMLESNYCMEAEWLLAMHFLGYQHPRQQDLVATLLKGQRPDGSWEAYYDAPQGDINGTVECYAALRAVGMSADDEPLVRARRWIFEHGGLRGIRVFTRYWLALLGEWPWSATPNLPPEVIANPRHWFVFDIYNFASWARATLLPLAVLSARRAVRPLPPERRLDELFPEGREHMDYRLPRRGPWVSWRRVFLFSDRFLHLYQQLGFTPFRETAINACLGWIVRHQDADGAWGGIQPPWIYSLMALNVEGYELTHPVIAKGLAALDSHWSYERGGTLHIQASESPVWDTLLALLAMQDCEREFTPAMTRALDWVLANEVRYPRRLDEEGQRRRAERLGIRARQSALSRHRRHGGRVDRALAFTAPAHRRAAYPRDDRPCACLDAGNAIEQRRLGSVRQRQRSADHHEDSVLRLRRGARSAVGRRHRARARSSGLARLRP